jgi:hypothetical protein
MEQQNNKETDKWATEAIRVLKERGYLEKTNRPVFMIAFAIIIAGMIAGGCILYAVNNDAFQSLMSNNQTVNCPQAPACPNIDIPACPTPYITCENKCVYPENLSIKLSNITI